MSQSLASPLRTLNVHVPKRVEVVHSCSATLRDAHCGSISVTHAFVEVSMHFVVFRLRSGIEQVSTIECTVVSHT